MCGFGVRRFSPRIARTCQICVAYLWFSALTCCFAENKIQITAHVLRTMDILLSTVMHMEIGDRTCVAACAAKGNPTLPYLYMSDI